MAKNGVNAGELLKADHRKVKELFSKYAQAKNDQEKETLISSIAMELAVHTAMEEQIFYPAAARALVDESSIEGSLEDHHQVKLFLSQIERYVAAEPEYDEKVKELQKAIEDHVQEEEEILIPKVERTGVDMDALGRQMLAYKNESSGGAKVA